MVIRIVWYYDVQVVLENSCRNDDHDLPFAQASIELTKELCEILKVGDMREFMELLSVNNKGFSPFWLINVQ